MDIYIYVLMYVCLIMPCPCCVCYVLDVPYAGADSDLATYKVRAFIHYIGGCTVLYRVTGGMMGPGYSYVVGF